MRSETLVCIVAICVAAILPPHAFAQMQFPKEDASKPRESGASRDLYGAASLYLLSGTVIDMVTTVRVLHHPTVASRPDGTMVARYYGMEDGWAGCLGRRSAFAAVAANIALNAGIYALSRKLYRRGGRWRTAAIALEVLKGTDNALAGFRNIGLNAGVDKRVRLATGYTGPLRWSH